MKTSEILEHFSSLLGNVFACSFFSILENASLNIKTVIRNIDDGCLQPIGKMLFYWNQQFNGENLPKGDYDVVATGIRSYTKQEVKVQRLQTLLGMVQNPALAPMVKLPYIIRELVKGMDMDPEEVINWYYSENEQLAGVESRVLEDAVVEKLLSTAAIAEVECSYQDALAKARPATPAE